MQATTTRPNGRGGPQGGFGGRPKQKTDFKTFGTRHPVYRQLSLARLSGVWRAVYRDRGADWSCRSWLQNIINTITNAYAANEILLLPAAVQPAAAQKLGMTVERLSAISTSANRDLIIAMVCDCGICHHPCHLCLYSIVQRRTRFRKMWLTIFATNFLPKFNGSR